MSKPAVLVTGGAGYIGSHAVLALKDAGWRVAVIDDLSNGDRSVVPEGVKFFHGSIDERVFMITHVPGCFFCSAAAAAASRTDCGSPASSSSLLSTMN